MIIQIAFTKNQKCDNKERKKIIRVSNKYLKICVGARVMIKEHFLVCSL